MYTGKYKNQQDEIQEFPQPTDFYNLENKNLLVPQAVKFSTSRVKNKYLNDLNQLEMTAMAGETGKEFNRNDIFNGPNDGSMSHQPLVGNELGSQDERVDFDHQSSPKKKKKKKDKDRDRNRDGKSKSRKKDNKTLQPLPMTLEEQKESAMEYIKMHLAQKVDGNDNIEEVKD